MNILLDGMNLGLEQGTGVATYARALIACLRAEDHGVGVLYGREAPAHADPVLREAAFFDAGAPARNSRLRRWSAFAQALRPVTPVEIPATGHVLRPRGDRRFPEGAEYLNHPGLFRLAVNRFRMGLGFLEVRVPERFDVVHWTFPMPVRAANRPNLYTVHDIVPLKLPYATLDVKRVHRRLLAEIARNAAAIVTDSETSRADILALLNIPEERVIDASVPVSLPVELLARDPADVAAELRGIAETRGPDGRARRLFESGGYYLFVGAIEPKKNLARMIEAYLAADVSEPLVVAGRRGWLCDAEMRLIERSPRIVHLDYVTLRQLVTLMQGARALLFASVYEGFGLPVIEGFLCGTPVVTAAIGSTAEIAGDAAILVDPYDVGAMRDVIRRLSGPDWPSLRSELSARGRVRAAAFAPERVASRFLDAYAAATSHRAA
ncbi:glycosyltransferase family 4 protein [Rubrimonas sp.]|uniref:glycosyltransferase family 4 protein n=1 Tax=Rubrimonas sp. TaxID=2036015 RepID=UPI002FDDAF3B